MSNDTTSFGRLIEAHIDQLNTVHRVDYWVADSALYRAAHLQLLSAHRARWLTRVPEMAKLAQQHSATVGSPTALLPGYGSRRGEVDYGGVRQRWLVITSVHAWQRAVPSIERQLGATSEHELKTWHRLRRRRFAWETDARQALLEFQATRKVLSLSEAAGQRLTPGRSSRWAVVGQPASDAQVLWFWLWDRLPLS